MGSSSRRAVGEVGNCTKVRVPVGILWKSVKRQAQDFAGEDASD